MDSAVRLLDLTVMHPQLLWEDIGAAVVAVLSDAGMNAPFSLELAIEDVPGFGSGALHLVIEPSGVSEEHVARLRRTYETSRKDYPASIHDEL